MSIARFRQPAIHNLTPNLNNRRLLVPNRLKFELEPGPLPVIPEAPTNLTAVPHVGDTWVLDWNTSQGADGYFVYRDGVKIETTVQSLTTVGQPGTYQVTAFNLGGESGPSNSVTLP